MNDIRFYIGKREGDNSIIDLTWSGNNGMLIAGQSGSGKSHTASFLLTQFAYLGVKLVICDFEAPEGEDETLSERCSHLENAFFLPPVSKAKDIRRYLDLMNREYEARLKDPNRREPLLFVIDEVSSYLASAKEDDSNAIHKFAQDALKIRKVNMRNMIIGQEWSSNFSTQHMRPIRSAFRTKIIHQLDSANAKMVLDHPTSDLIRAVGKLRTGQVMYNDEVVNVPMLTEAFKTKTCNLLLTLVKKYVYNWTPDDEKLYMDALYKYAAKIRFNPIRVPMDTKEDLIRALLSIDKTEEWILKNIKGHKNELLKTIRSCI